MKMKLFGLLLMFFAMTAFVACNESATETDTEDECTVDPMAPNCQAPTQEETPLE